MGARRDEEGETDTKDDLNLLKFPHTSIQTNPRMTVKTTLGLLALLGLGSAVSAEKHDVFSAEDMLSTPRPQPALASPNGHRALSVVDQWDPKEDV